MAVGKVAPGAVISLFLVMRALERSTAACKLPRSSCCEQHKFSSVAADWDSSLPPRPVPSVRGVTTKMLARSVRAMVAVLTIRLICYVDRTRPDNATNARGVSENIIFLAQVLATNDISSREA